MKAFYENVDENEIKITESHGTYPAHFHASVEILYCRKGKLTVLLNGETLTLNKNEFIIFDEDDIHAVLSSNDYLTILLPPSRLGEYLAFKGERTLRARIFLDDGQIMPLIIQLTDNNLNRLTQIGLVSTILGKITQRTKLVSKKTVVPNDMRAIPEFLRSRFTQKLSLSSVANELGYNKYYLSGAFKSYFGVTFTEYITSLRLNYFILLMERGSMPITAAIFESGFSSIQTFYRTFKKQFGCSPKTFCGTTE